MKPREEKKEKRAWGIAVGAGGIVLIAEGLIELIKMVTSQQLAIIIAPIVLGMLLFYLAIKIVPELKSW